MTTPNLTAGVLERVKPVVVKSHLVWRFEGILNAGQSITTPIFDQIPDGQPLTEIEVGTATVVRIPGPNLRIAVVVPSGSASNNPGAVLNVFHVQDSGGQQAPFTWYVQPRAGSGANLYRYEMIGRRCQFRFANTPLGPVAALGQTWQVEITAEG